MRWLVGTSNFQPHPLLGIPFETQLAEREPDKFKNLISLNVNLSLSIQMLSLKFKQLKLPV